MFAGIGGFRSGMEQAGHKCVGWIEWDKFARKSYQAIYNTEGEYNAKDIQTVSGGNLPDANVWCFGSPCTNISLAGNRKGLEGEQSRMFFEVIRLLEERVENKETLPAYLFMENVKNLLSSNDGRDFARVQIEMDKAGYDVEWNVFNSAEVVPQNRERVYIIGHLRGSSTRKVFPIIRKSETTNQKQQVQVVGHYGKKDHQSNTVISDQGVSNTLSATDYKHPQVVVNQVGNVSKSKSFGGNPQVGRVYATDGLAPTLNTMQGGGRQPKILVKPCLTPDRINKRQQGRRFKNDGDPSFTLTGQDRHGVLLEKSNQVAIRKLTPLECWRLQGFTDEQFNKAKDAGVSNSQLYKQSGNAATVSVVYQIARRLQIDE